MGKTPTINPAAMNSLATKALLTKAGMAKSSDNNGNGIPSEDDATVIQDVLSMATSVNFFGKRTKRYKKKDSEELEDFYTIPVEYKFPDSGTRQVAEESLKAVCKVKTTVAYPANVRECIKQAYEYGKKKYKDSYIIVNLDAPSFRLVMKRRTKDDRQWTHVKQGFRLPDECLDTAHRAGQNVRLIFDPPTTPTRLNSQGSRSESGTMEDETVFHSPHNTSIGRREESSLIEEGAASVCSNVQN